MVIYLEERYFSASEVLDRTDDEGFVESEDQAEVIATVFAYVWRGWFRHAPGVGLGAGNVVISVCCGWSAPFLLIREIGGGLWPA